MCQFCFDFMGINCNDMDLSAHRNQRIEYRFIIYRKHFEGSIALLQGAQG